MKVVILAGGYGTRLSEYTKLIPKPVVSWGVSPIILKIINLYKKYGFKRILYSAWLQGNYQKFFKNRFKDLNIRI